MLETGTKYSHYTQVKRCKNGLQVYSRLKNELFKKSKMLPTSS